MKQTLLSVKLRGLRGVHAVMLLTFLSLFMSFEAAAQAKVNLPTRYNGKFKVPLTAPSTIAGWSQTGLDTDPLFSLNAATTVDNASGTQAAKFTAVNAELNINFNGVPNELSFLYNTTDTKTFIGNFAVYEAPAYSADIADYTLVQGYTNLVGSLPANSKSHSEKLLASTRSVKFVLLEKSASSTATSFFVDYIAVSAAAPVITSFTPSIGPVGTKVTILGSNFVNSTGVLFNGLSGTNFTIVSDSEISAIVPSGATSGRITVLNNSTSSVSQSDFTVVSAPTISSVIPNEAKVGESVVVNGSNLDNLQSVTINGAPALVTNGSSTQLTVLVPENAAVGTGLLQVTTSGGTANYAFTVISTDPIITSFSPGSGSVGDLVTVNGANIPEIATIAFMGADGELVFSEDPAINADGTQITGSVPLGAVTGKIYLIDENAEVVAESTGEFVVNPYIISFSPGSGSVGDLVTVNGANIPGIATIAFMGADGELVFSEDPAINADGTQITGSVPLGAVTGKIYLIDENAEVVAESTGEFYVAPDIISLSPERGEPGVKVAITGTNLTDIQYITINGANAQYEFVNGVSTATVPEDASSGLGSLIVSTLGGMDSAPFTVENPVLPVELVAFTATPTSAGAKLTWQTGSEQDNAYFEVQSTNNLKSGEFKTVGRVDSKVINSSILQSYSYLDATAARGTTVYYRLKQVDTDGDFEYSKVVTVNIKQGATAKGLVNVYPNPFKEQINLEVEAETAGSLVATLYDARGYKVFARSINVEVGTSNIIIDLPANLRTGLYFLTTQVDGNTKTTRLIKE